MNRMIAIRCGLVVALCFSALVVLSPGSTSFGAPPNPGQAADASKAWIAPDPATIPAGPLGDSIRLGLHVFNETPKYTERYVGNKLSCTHCHIDGGTVSKGMPMVGLLGIFPMYRDREKTVITFEERIQQCFQRSEFGHRLPNDGPEMTGLVAYTQWLSKDQVAGRPFPGRGSRRSSRTEWRRREGKPDLHSTMRPLPWGGRCGKTSCDPGTLGSGCVQRWRWDASNRQDGSVCAAQHAADRPRHPHTARGL